MEQCFTSQPTQYRLYGRQFLQTDVCAGLKMPLPEITKLIEKLQYQTIATLGQVWLALSWPSIQIFQPVFRGQQRFDMSATRLKSGGLRLKMTPTQRVKLLTIFEVSSFFTEQHQSSNFPKILHTSVPPPSRLGRILASPLVLHAFFVHKF